MEPPSPTTSTKTPASPSPPPPDVTFKFLSLPLEIRLRIWSLLTPPQVIDIVCPTAPRPGEASIYSPKSSASTTTSSSPPTSNSSTVLLQTCHESRSLILRKRKQVAGVWFDPKSGILYLADPQAILHENRTSSLRVLREALSGEKVHGIGKGCREGKVEVGYLALSYISWRKNGIFGELGELVNFQGLKRIWVVFLGDVSRDERKDGTGERGEKEVDIGQSRNGKERGWLGEVKLAERENRLYLEMVEREVNDDLYELEKKNNGWKAPELRFVRDRGELDLVVEGIEE